MDAWWLDLVVDPVDRRPLHLDGRELVAADGTRYPLVNGIPVLLRADLPPTHGGQNRTLKIAELARAGFPIGPLSAANLPKAAKEAVGDEIADGSDAAQAIIRRLIPLTNGFGYRHLTPSETITVPTFPELGAGELLLDVGCAWGRWTIAAARAGFRVIGVDPIIGHLLAAQRFSASLGINVGYICGDARCLPLQTESFDRVFSYSVFQHFSDQDCMAALTEIARVLKFGGSSRIQMAHRGGARSLWHQAWRGFRAPTRFEVRYRSLSQLGTMFVDTIGETSASIDCFFGLGLQASEIDAMKPLARIATTASELLKRVATTAPPLIGIADSLFMRSTKNAAAQPQG
jgi:uncharacterized protein YbaR (Trm112 family)